MTQIIGEKQELHQQTKICPPEIPLKRMQKHTVKSPSMESGKYNEYVRNIYF